MAQSMEIERGSEAMYLSGAWLFLLFMVVVSAPSPLAFHSLASAEHFSNRLPKKNNFNSLAYSIRGSAGQSTSGALATDRPGSSRDAPSRNPAIATPGKA